MRFVRSGFADGLIALKNHFGYAAIELIEKGKAIHVAAEWRRFNCLKFLATSCAFPRPFQSNDFKAVCCNHTLQKPLQWRPKDINDCTDPVTICTFVSRQSLQRSKVLMFIARKLTTSPG